MADRLYNTLQLPLLAPGATSAAFPHDLHLGLKDLVPNLVAAPGCSVIPSDVTATTIKVKNEGSIAFAPEVMVWYIHDVARVLGVNGTVQPSINPFILTNSGGGGGSGALELVNASTPTGVLENLVSDFGAGDTNNTPALQLAFADLTTRHRAMYAYGRYVLDDGASPDEPEILAGQSIHLWGDGSEQSLWAFTKTADLIGFHVHGDGVGGRLRIEDTAILGTSVAGPGLFNAIFLNPEFPALGSVEARHVAINGANQNTSAVLLNGGGFVLLEDFVLGPNVTRPLRNEAEGACGTWTLSRGSIDSFDFCIDHSSQNCADMDQIDFVRSRDIGAGSLAINRSNPANSTAAIPDHYRVSRSSFHPECLMHYTTQSPYLAIFDQNVHTLGAGGIGLRAGGPMLIRGSQFTSPAVTPWASGAQANLGTRSHHDGARIYVVVSPGITGGVGPTGTGAGIIDGGVTWDYAGPGVLALDNTAFSADDADIALAQIDGFIAMGDRTQVTGGGDYFTGITFANVLRDLDAGVTPWRLWGATFENYADFAASRFNIVQHAGEILIDNAQFRRAPHGGASGAATLHGGIHRVRSSHILDGDYIVDAFDGDVELHAEACHVNGTFQVQSAAGHLIKLYGWENEFPTSGGFVGAGDLTKIQGFVTPRVNKGADISGGGQLLGYANANMIDVIDAGVYNDMIANIGFVGPWMFRAVAAFTPVQAGNIAFLKPGVSGVPMTVGDTLIMIRDPINHLFYQI